MARRMDFYDVKTKEKFSTNNYTVVKIGKRKALKTTSPSGIKAFRFVGKDFEK